MKKNFVILLLVFVSCINAQTVFDFKQFGVDTEKFVKAPLKWNASDLAKLGVMSAVTYSLFYADEPVRDFFKDYPGYDRNPLLTFGKISGEPLTSIGVGLYFMIQGKSTNNRANEKLGFEVLQSFFYTGTITQSLKYIIGRSRPSNGLGAFLFKPLSFHGNDYMSLNSGHTAVAFSLWTVIAENQSSDFARYICYLPPVVTALSRVYHDRHWLSDVFLGAAIGYFIGKWSTKQHTIYEPVEPNDIITFSFGIN